jgi:UDP-N-acetylglucosamine diphosphorylase/glucosamine-1-phosphate N-acetyltransferase
MQERWAAYLPGSYTYLTEEYLTEIFTPCREESADDVYLAGNIVATPELAIAVDRLEQGERLVKSGRVIAYVGREAANDVEYSGDVIAVDRVYDIFMKNDLALQIDFSRVTAGRESAPIDSTNIVLGDPSLIFIEEGATVEASTLNTRQGPIYIGRDAVVMEGCCLRGPIAMCEHSVANMGALIYGATTLGPWCKVGGELHNVVMLGYANKAHDGFLGNAVIGEWCNLGGGTVASNLKNDYTEIKLWDYPAQRFLRTGLQFCGLIMGDHSKSAINTSFNTATVVGVGCNIVSEGMPRVFIPSFSKGGTSGFEDVNLNEFFAVAARVMARRGCCLTPEYRHVFETINAFADRFK